MSEEWDLSARAAAGQQVSEAGMVSTVASATDASADGGVEKVLFKVPLIREAGETTFDDVVATSRAVPVIVVMWAKQSLESRPVVDDLEALARESEGAFQLVTINVEDEPAFIEAFQIQALPSAVALLAGTPVPLFQGTATKEQIRPVIAQLREAGEQRGVTGWVEVSQEDMAAPIPPEHLPALEAEAAGDLDGAVALWEKIVELNPRDHDAKAHLARVGLKLRAGIAGGDADDPKAQADQLFAAGHIEQAFDVLLTAIGQARGEERDELRIRLLELFRVAGNTDEVKGARRRLSTLVMI